ncbi:MFS transporter [Stutzerimonas tarimensis]|uniref:MFS transporter n=1 Tax=Stutzerimonas tarimensis TaxID=1507735 RepID=A0ABV7T6Z2_9GAMM
MKRSFGIVWVSQTLVIFSVVLVVFTAGILTYQHTDSLISFSLVILCGYLPELFVMPLAGPWIDRWPRKRILLGCCFIQCLVFSTYWLNLAADEPSMPLVYAVLLLSSLVGGVHRLAYNASLTLFTRNDRAYPRLNGVAQAGLASAHVLAPLVAGTLLTLTEGWLVAAVAATACLLAGLVMLRVDFPELPSTRRWRSSKRDFWVGARYLARARGLRLFLLMHAFANLARGASVVLFTPFILEFASEAVLGTLRSVAGLGMALGAVFMVVWGGPVRQLRGVIVSLTSCGLFMALIGLTRAPLVIGLATFALFVATPILAALAHSIWQRRVPASVQGRVFGLRDSLAGAALALGYVASPWVAAGLFEPLAGSRVAGIAALYVTMGLATVALAVVVANHRAVRRLGPQD